MPGLKDGLMRGLMRRLNRGIMRSLMRRICAARTTRAGTTENAGSCYRFTMYA